MKILGIIIGFWTILGTGLFAEKNIAALGRIEPKGGILHLQGPEGRALKVILAKTNEWVRAGEVIAVFQGDPSKGLQLRIEKHKMKLLEKEQAASLALYEKELLIYADKIKRYKEIWERLSSLKGDQKVLEPILEDKKEAWLQAKDELTMLSLKLEREKSQMEREKHLLQTTINKLEISKNDFKLIAPVSGQILRFFYQPGERIDGRQPFALLGDTKRIEVVAEVYEMDALKLKEGLPVKVSSNAFVQKIIGKVQSIGHLIFKNNISGYNPNAMTQTRVVEVRIDVEEASPLNKLILMQVDVLIGPIE